MNAAVKQENQLSYRKRAICLCCCDVA